MFNSVFCIFHLFICIFYASKFQRQFFLFYFNLLPFLNITLLGYSQYSLLRQPFSQLLHCLFFQPRHLYLRNTELTRARLLGLPAKISQQQNVLRPNIQSFHGFSQRQRFNHTFLHTCLSKHLFQCRAVLSDFALQRIRRQQCGLASRNFFRRNLQPIGNLVNGRRSGQRLMQRFPRRVHAIAQFFDTAADFHCAVIAQKPPNFSGNFGHRIGRKSRAICAVKALYRLEQSNASQLKQVLCLCAASCVSLDNAPNQRLVVSDKLFLGGCVAALRQSQQAQLFVTSVQNELLCAWSSRPACRCLRASERAACP